MRVAVIGGTGLVGRLLLDRLSSDEDVEVHLLTRRSTGRSGPRFYERVAPATDWPNLLAAIAADAAISTLGTTMRKAGSEAAFKAVDQDTVLAFARAAHAAGARRLATVSSVGADPASRNFYLRTKGASDTALAQIGFDRLDIFRPGLLRGERGADRRPAERLGILLSPLMNLALRGPLGRYAAIDAALVAAAIHDVLHQPGSGRFVHENKQIHDMGR